MFEKYRKHEQYRTKNSVHHRRGSFFGGTIGQTFSRVAAVGKVYCLFRNVSASATTAATTTTTTNDRVDEEADESERAAWMALPVERGPQGSADSRFRSGVRRCYPIENARPDPPCVRPPSFPLPPSPFWSPSSHSLTLPFCLTRSSLIGPTGVR